MIQDIGRYTVRVRGRYTMDGGMLWMASSLSEIGFRVSEAKILQVMLQIKQIRLSKESTTTYTLDRSTDMHGNPVLPCPYRMNSRRLV